MPSPPISPTSLSPSSKMASLASILHHGTTPLGGQQSTSSKSTPAPSSSSAFRQATSPPPPLHHHQSHPHHQHLYRQGSHASVIASPTSPPPGFGSNSISNNFITPLSPTTVASAGTRVQEELPFYHQLEQVQRVREGKFGGGSAAAAGAAAAPLPLSAEPSTAAAAASYASYSGDAPSSKNGFSSLSGGVPGGATFERQIAEVEEAKEVLRKAGASFGPGAPGGPGGYRGSIGGRGSIAQRGGPGDDALLKVQVQGDGNARVRMMSAAEEADRDEGGVRAM